MRFLALLKLTTKNKTETHTIKYFLPQALGSVFLFIGFFLSVFYRFTYFCWLASLFLKLGLFPFFSWFISLSKRISFLGLWIISVPQKITPFWLILTINNNFIPRFKLFQLSIFGGVFVSICRVLQTRRLGLILGYSSLINRSWFLLIIRENEKFLFIFFLYGIALFWVTRFLRTLKASTSRNSIKQESFSWGRVFTLILLFLNLGGLPPFINIWGKGLILYSLFLQGAFLWFMCFCLSSVVFMYAYLRTCLGLRVLSAPRNHLLRENNTSKNLFIVILFARAILFFSYLSN